MTVRDGRVPRCKAGLPWVRRPASGACTVLIPQLRELLEAAASPQQVQGPEGVRLSSPAWSLPRGSVPSSEGTGRLLRPWHWSGPERLSATFPIL